MIENAPEAEVEIHLVQRAEFLTVPKCLREERCGPGVDAGSVSVSVPSFVGGCLVPKAFQHNRSAHVSRYRDIDVQRCFGSQSGLDQASDSLLDGLQTRTVSV